MLTCRAKARIAACMATIAAAGVGVQVAPQPAYAAAGTVTVNYGDWNCPTGYNGARGVVIRLTGVSISPPGDSVWGVPGRSASLRAFLNTPVNVDATLTCRVKVAWYKTQDFPNVNVNVVRYFQFAGHNMWI